MTTINRKTTAVLGLLFFFLLCVIIPASAQDETGSPDNDEQKMIRAINRVSPSVVKIETVTGKGDSGLGSGIILKDNGYILTNLHVLRNASRIVVTLYNKKKFNAVLVGQSPQNDLAVLKINSSGLTVPNWGDSRKLKIGQVAIAIGNPYKFEGSVSRGIISALDRRIPASGIIYKDLIQTDAAINPGNSGGALINSDGRVIGINTLVYTGQRGHSAQGLGFAIPIHRALDVARVLMAREVKYSPKPWIGINGRTITREMAEMNMFPVNMGVMITEIQPVSPAERAGLRRADIVIRVDNQLVRNVEDFQKILSEKKPGDNMEILLWREEKRMTVDVKISQRTVPQ